MTTLLEIRDRVIEIYRQFENIFVLAFKFLAVLTVIAYINNHIGYQETLKNPMFAVVLALVGTLLPTNLDIILICLVMVLHLYSLSLEAAAVGLILVLLLLLLYFRFAPRDSMLILLYPAASAMGISYALPIVGGLMYHATSGVTCAVGAIIVYFIRFIQTHETAIGTVSEDSDMISRFRFIIDGLMQNREMIVVALAAFLASIAVYVIRRTGLRFSWLIATVVGGVLQFVVILMGVMTWSFEMKVGGVFLGVIAAILVGCVMTFFLMNLDYSRVEETQFEDNDYYYYVKAIPKNTFNKPARSVKKINPSRRVQGSRAASYRPEVQDPYYAEDAYYPAEDSYSTQDDGYGSY